MNLAIAFVDCAAKHAQKTAIFYGEREISYAELQSQSLKVGEYLQNKLGVKPGDRVALWLKNCPQFVVSVFGVLQTGAVVVPINNFLKPAEVSYILNDGGIDVVITDAELGAHSQELKAGRPSLKFFQIEEIDALTASDSRFTIHDSRTEKDLAVIIYTSGTTGKPKGAMLSHGNLLHNV
jgi:long-chain acyl-CoA synthetase